MWAGNWDLAVQTAKLSWSTWRKGGDHFLRLKRGLVRASREEVEGPKPVRKLHRVRGRLNRGGYNNNNNNNNNNKNNNT